MIFLIIFIPNEIVSVRDKKLVFLKYIFCAVLQFFYFKTLNEDLSSIIPYEFFF